jgi:hypothetical protein
MLSEKGMKMSEENKSIIKQSTQKFSEHYSENPLTALLLTALGIAVPQIALGKEAIDRAVSKIQKERFQTLLDKLAKGEKLITPELVQTEEFIHSFVVVYQASMNTFQREKIRRFARILLSAIERDELASDKFEEYVKILESLSERELFILNTLHSLELRFGVDGSGTKSNGEKLKQVRAELEKVLFFEGISSQEELPSILYRLSGTGLYTLAQGMVFGHTGGFGSINPTFRDFSEWIKLENEKLNADG